MPRIVCPRPVFRHRLRLRNNRRRPTMATEKDPAGDDGGNKTNPPAPRKKSQKRQRKWLIKIPCLQQEFNDIAAAAEAANLTKAAFGRLSMLGKTGDRSPPRGSSL